MEEIKPEDLFEKETVTPTVEEATTDPLQVELEKVQKKEGRTEAEKAAYSLKKNAERVRELGLDPTDILGFKATPKVDEDIENEDDKPLTIGQWKKMQKEQATKTALDLAEDITSPVEKELVKYHIENSIRSTGNPSEDLALARAIVNSKKNSQIVEEQSRKVAPKTYVPNGGSAPAKEPEVEFTKEELALMKFAGLSKEEVLKARPKA